MIVTGSNFDPSLPSIASFMMQRKNMRSATHSLQRIDPALIRVNRYTRIKTVCLFGEGLYEVEPRGTAGEMHQFTIPGAGCSTSLTILDGERIMYCMPVQQTGSFKLELGFSDGLYFEVCSAKDAPPHFTINWRRV